LRARKLVLPFLVCVAAAWPATAAAASKTRVSHGPEASRGTASDASRPSCDRRACSSREATASKRKRRPRLVPIDGGRRYYARFSPSLPSNRRYFPIGVWFESATNRADVRRDKRAGLNVYVVLTADSNMSLVRRSGMKVIVQSSERHRFSGVGRETVGWELMDEIDMTDGPPGGDGFRIIEDILGGLPDDRRLRYNNYGKGVLLWQDDPWPARWVNQYQDIVSTDLYWFTDPNQIGMTGPPWLPEHGRQMSLSEVRRAANYGYQIDRLRDLDGRDGRRKPIWAFVEVGWPFTESASQGARAIRPAEIRAAVWHSLIAGARGIVYFNHSFGGPGECQTQHALRDLGCYGRTRSVVKRVNRRIRRLAPVLNSPFVRGLVSAAGRVRTMVKYRRGRFYVFAGNRANAARSATFRARCVGNATAKVLGEGRSIPVRRGRFADSFADGNAIHIYRLDGGSRCGL
jgi:hypothetical protein